MSLHEACHRLAMSWREIRIIRRKMRSLNDQHQTVAILWAHGYNSKEIALALSADHSTVGAYLARCANLFGISTDHLKKHEWFPVILAGIGAILPYDLSTGNIEECVAKAVSCWERKEKAKDNSRMEVCLKVLQEAGKPMLAREIAETIFVNRLHRSAKLKEMNPVGMRKYINSLNSGLRGHWNVFFVSKRGYWWIRDEFLKATSLPAGDPKPRKEEANGQEEEEKETY